MRNLSLLTLAAASAALVLAPAAVGSPADEPVRDSVASTEPITLDQRTRTIRRAAFRGSGKYTTTGRATVRQRGKTRTLQLARSFRADPDSIRLLTYLATSPNGANAVNLGRMRERGAQRFRIPRRANLSRHRYVVAWCDAVDEPVGYALLKRR
jgi:hypothetical protein